MVPIQPAVDKVGFKKINNYNMQTGKKYSYIKYIQKINALTGIFCAVFHMKT